MNMNKDKNTKLAINMEDFSKLWWIFAILGGITIALNPDTRVIAGANAGELFILFCLNIISSIVRKKYLKVNGENKIIKVLIRKLGNLSYFIPIGLFFVKLFGAVIIFLSIPNQSWVNPYGIIVSIVVEMIFNVLLLIAFIYKGTILKRMTNDNQYINVDKLKYRKLNITCIITLTISIIIGLFNPYAYYITFIWNFWYPFAMFIYFINLWAVREALKNRILNLEFTYDYCKRMEGKKIKIFMIGSLCFMKILFAVLQFDLYSVKLVLDNSLIMFMLSTIAEIVVVITFSIRIWKESSYECKYKFP